MKRQEKLIKTIRSEAEKLNKYVGILMDLAGPKIRVDLTNIGDGSLEIKKNYVYSLGYSKMNDIPINMDLNFKNYAGEKAFVKIDDGNINFADSSFSITGSDLSVNVTTLNIDATQVSYPAIVYPNGGENLFFDRDQTFEWSFDGIADSVYFQIKCRIFK